MGNIKTLDGKDCNFLEYKQACAELTKGLVTKAEVEETLELVELHNKLIYFSMDTIKRLAIHHHESEEAMCKLWREYENDMSIKAYQKAHQCMSRNEHIDVIKVLLDECKPIVENIILPESSATENSSLERMFRLNRRFTDNEKLYK